jgi:ribose transport system substrate-binding protein
VISTGGITKHFGSIQAPPARPRRPGWRSRLISTGAALCLVSAALFGVGAPAASSSARFVIELIPGLTVEPFYITMHYGAEQEAAKLGVTLEWAGATTFSPTTQIPVVNSVLATKPSALLIAPTDANALFFPMDAYVQAGIPVIAVDTTLANTSILTSAISSDNYEGGEKAADAIASLAHDKGQVAVINVMPNVSTTDSRQAGFLAEMKRKYSNMKVVAHVYDQDSPTTAESEARSIIRAHPGLVGIFGTNLYSAQGAGKGVDAAGDKGKVFVAGYDAEPLEVNLLKRGVINILVIQNPAEEGSLAVQYAYDYLTGDKSAIKKSVLLPNVVATTANANHPSVSKYYYKTSA